MGTNMPLLKCMAWGCLLLFVQKLQCLQKFQYDVAMWVSKSHKSAKFHTLIWCGLLVTLAEFKKEEEEEEEEEDEEFWSL